MSIQLGNPQKLATQIKKNVIFDFRSNDLRSGGHGAPLAPIYHKIIIEDLKLELPACILNIGGVSNVSYWDGENLVGFDTGPGNAMLDDYMRLECNKFFDKNGLLASKGIPDMRVINKFLKDSFFNKKPPKSLDRNTFIHLYQELLDKNLSKSDTMATLVSFTIEAIAKGFKFFPKKIKSIIVTGGGYKNTYLMKELKKKLQMKPLSQKKLDMNFDFIEAELIALLSARSLYNLPYTFPNTTGVLRESSGGKFYQSL